MRFDPNLHAKMTQELKNAGIEDAELEAKWIIEDSDSIVHALSIANRRAQHEPLQYLLGEWEFYGLKMFVGEGVLIPRADTETLIDTVLAEKLPANSHALDLCTGSGCIALALKKMMPALEIAGLDNSTQALAYAKKNAESNHLDVEFLCMDVLAPRLIFRNLDLIVCNPPYLTDAEMEQLQPEVRFEPEQALRGGADGLDFYRRITAVWKDSLRQNGLIAFEVGYTQADAAAEILEQNGFTAIRKISDLGGNLRVVTGRK